MRRVFAGLVAVASLGLAGRWLLSPAAELPDVYLFTVDTVRADHTTVYGYERDTTPWLAEIAEEGVVFERCVSNSSWTVPSMTALQTGQHPWVYGMHAAPSVLYGGRNPLAEQPVLPDEARTLAERFEQAGYQTIGITANAHLHQRFGWAAGFDYYANVGFNPAAAVDAQFRELARRQPDTPQFWWIHLFDPHDPYLPTPSPWEDPSREANEHGSFLLPNIELELREDLKSGDGLQALVDLYDGEIWDADAWLAHASRQLNIGPEDIVLFASDHGEEFQERGHFGHRRTLHEESVRVPCVLRGPGVEARRDPRVVDMIDLHQTLLGVAGLEPADGPGRDLRSDADRPILAHLSRGQEQHWAIYRDDSKQIEEPGSSRRFDLVIDPLERTELPADETLSKAIRDELTRYPIATPRLFGEGEREELEALGYVDR